MILARSARIIPLYRQTVTQCRRKRCVLQEQRLQLLGWVYLVKVLFSVESDRAPPLLLSLITVVHPRHGPAKRAHASVKREYTRDQRTRHQVASNYRNRVGLGGEIGRCEREGGGAARRRPLRETTKVGAHHC